MTRRILVAANLATYAGAGEIADEFRRRPDHDVRFVVLRRDESQSFWRRYDATIWTDLDRAGRLEVRDFAAEADLTVVAGTPSLTVWAQILRGLQDIRRRRGNDYVERKARRLASHAARRAVALLITDSNLLYNKEQLNRIYGKIAPARIFAMPDLIPHVETAPALPIWPAVPAALCASLAETRPDRATPLLGHSPSMKERFDQKGTEFILDVVKRNGLEIDLITGLAYEAALERKSQVDIFIDQVSYQKYSAEWTGGIGKSGLEALACGCALITSGELADTAPHFPMPPVAMVDRDTFEPALLRLIEEHAALKARAAESRDWVEQCASPRAVVDFIARHSL